MTFQLFTSTAMIVALVSVGFTEVVKKNLPDATPTWVKSILNLVFVVAFSVLTGIINHQQITEIIMTVFGSYGIAQVEYNYLWKTFTAVIENLKSKNSGTITQEEAEEVLTE